MHGLAGVCGNIGAKEIYNVAYPLSTAFKILSNEGKLQLSVPHQKQLLYIQESVMKLSSQIEIALKNNNSSKVEVPQAEWNQEEWSKMMFELRAKCEGQDGDCFDFLSLWIKGKQVPSEWTEYIETLQGKLEDFEFDQALEIINLRLGQ
jgi:HPt (histidine-containing phosphotransfer) domain-containing protein